MRDLWGRPPEGEPLRRERRPWARAAFRKLPNISLGTVATKLAERKPVLRRPRSSALPRGCRHGGSDDGSGYLRNQNRRSASNRYG